LQDIELARISQGVSKR
jgi:Enoyl-(Acyl carrier protein) reductase